MTRFLCPFYRSNPKVNGLKLISVQKLTQEQLKEYEKSPQESL